MMVVLEIATIAPAKKLSRGVQPNARPVTKPSQIITLLWITAVSPAVGPTRTSFFRLNSSPSENMSRITPSSDSVCTIAGSAISGIGTCGPMMRPAMM